MTDPFTIIVSLRGEEREFTAQWQPYGYTHRFTVQVGELTVFFEPDEEGRYRAVIAPGQDEAAVKTAGKNWLEAIQHTIEAVLK